MAHLLYMRLDDGPMEPAEFRVTQAFDGAKIYSICCPRCAAVSVLPPTHRVHRSGAVTPIWACPDEACPYADWLNCMEELR